MTFYKKDHLLVSGGSNGQVLFWSKEGTIIKKIMLFKTAVSNLLMINRPFELDQRKSLIHYKKQISFKPFKK